MKSYKILHSFLVSTLILCHLNCCNSTEPTDELNPGRRDYGWSIDTLNIPFTVLTRIWGNTPTDVWAVGPGGDKDKTIYHFNGSRWSTDGINRPLSPTSIFGFATNNVWIGGQGGELWNYDGNSWKKYFSLNIPGYNFYILENIWGDNSNNIYGTGFAEDSINYKGIIVKYDGMLWKNIEIQELKNSFVKILKSSESSDNYFILGYRIEPFAEDTSFIYEFDGNNFKTFYKGITTTDQIADVFLIDKKIYVRKGYDIFEIEDNEQNFVLRLPNEATLVGRNKKDIFLCQSDGVSHYNGNNIEYLYQFQNSNIFINGAAIFNDEIFILYYDNNLFYNLILHGKLK